MRVNGTYQELIDFCQALTIKDLARYKEFVRSIKNKPYLVANEVLKIRISQRK